MYEKIDMRTATYEIPPQEVEQWSYYDDVYDDYDDWKYDDDDANDDDYDPKDDDDDASDDDDEDEDDMICYDVSPRCRSSQKTAWRFLSTPSCITR